MFREINAWFNTLQETKRFLVFMGAMLLWLIPLYAGILGGFSILTLIGLIGMTFMCFLAIARVRSWGR